MILARVLLAAMLFATWWPVMARAERPRKVLMLVDGRREPLIAEVSARLGGELAAEGFVVEQRAAPSGPLPPQRAVETAHTDDEGTGAVLLITPLLELGTTRGLEIWLRDRWLGQTFVSRLRSESITEPAARAQLAVRTVELLHARLFEHALGRDGGAADDGWQTARVAFAPPAPSREAATDPHVPVVVGLAAGLGLLSSSLGQVWLPVTTLSIALPVGERLAFDLALSGGALGQRVHAVREEGEVAISQAFVRVGGALRIRASRWLEPSLGGAAGAHVLSIMSRAIPPHRARDGSHVSPMFSAGVALRTRIWARLHGTLGLDALFMSRPGTIRVVTHEVARAGYVSALARFELMVVF